MSVTTYKTRTSQTKQCVPGSFPCQRKCTQLVTSCMSSLCHCSCHSCFASHAPVTTALPPRTVTVCKGSNAGLPDCGRAKQPARRKKAAAATKQASAEPSLQPPTTKRYRVPPKSALVPSQAWAWCFTYCFDYLLNASSLSLGLALWQEWVIPDPGCWSHFASGFLSVGVSVSYTCMHSILSSGTQAF